MAAYTKTDFDTQAAAFVTAIQGNNILAAAQALVIMDAILASLGFNLRTGDGGMLVQRRDSLKGIWQNVFGDMSYYAIYAEQVGTLAETMFPAPAGVEPGVGNTTNINGTAPQGS